MYIHGDEEFRPKEEFRVIDGDPDLNEDRWLVSNTSLFFFFFFFFLLVLSRICLANVTLRAAARYRAIPIAK